MVLVAGISAAPRANGKMTGRDAGETEKATFAGGCFWCIEAHYEEMDGVLEAVSGYIGGKTENPDYESVCSGKTGHLEAVQVTFNPDIISYETLLERFWRSIDPTQADGQFADRGSQYQTAIFYHNDEQRKKAEESRARLDASGKFAKPVVTDIRKASRFYPAEDYHQGYYRKNPMHFRMYKIGSGRQGFLEKTWEEEDKNEP